MASDWTLVEKNIMKNVKNPYKYKVILYFGRDDNGKMKKSSKIIDGSLSDARAFLINHESDMVKQVAMIPQKKSLEDLIYEWNTIGDGIRTEKTTQTSNKNIQKHLLGYFKNKKLKDISAKDIRAYLAYLITDKGLSTNTANKHRSHLGTLFNYAMSEPEEYGVFKNPVELVRPFKKVKKKYDIFQPEEAKEVLIALHQSKRHDLEVAVNLAFWCGVRREEVCALKWSNVDLNKREITICEVRTTANGKVYERDGTKNNTIRKVGIAPWLYNVLLKELEHQNTMKSVLEQEYFNGNYVFCHDDGKPWHPNSVTREFHDFLEKNHFKIIRFHDLRHTNLSILMQHMSAIDVAAWGGHQQVSTTTDIYGHSFGHVVQNGVGYMSDVMHM